MTLFELVDEVWEKTHVDRAEIFARVHEVWPGKEEFNGTQCALLVRALGRATPARCAPLRQL